MAKHSKTSGPRPDKGRILPRKERRICHSYLFSGIPYGRIYAEIEEGERKGKAKRKDQWELAVCEKLRSELRKWLGRDVGGKKGEEGTR